MAWDVNEHGIKLVFGTQSVVIDNGQLASKATLISAITKQAKAWGLNNFVVEVNGETIADPQDLPEVEEMPAQITLKPYAKAGC